MISGSEEWMDLYEAMERLVSWIDEELVKWWAVIEYAKL